MAKHDVAFSIPAKFVLSKDVEFDVRSDGANWVLFSLARAILSGYRQTTP